jgi:hypothetical protein
MELTNSCFFLQSEQRISTPTRNVYQARVDSTDIDLLKYAALSWVPLFFAKQKAAGFSRPLSFLGIPTP